ncbi:tetratricopeptide repeat protein [Thermomonas brevis]|uniref:Tetratricopeptide repeat protein n=1 Tax=Thermomonas brevis TaxID=215691 RepID=A0A7G9QRK4_9GAMM|nr:serine/threonine-protein kinase [Thermomonas brevis]QNN45979.1 tetratricopeptide repeat protein [Thermomonas brevis]
MSGGERLARVLRLFDEALEQPAATRAAWLAQACGDDAALRRDVEAMLAADAAGADDPLTPKLAGLRTDTDAPAEDELPPDARIGPWRVRGVLGRGGMGAVYRVARADGDYEHDAALKRIRIGLDSAQARERFLRERRILARLRHPGIAGLIDGGVDDAGAPYFVMTLVDGERIDRWCDARALDVRARIRLLLQVLDAVAFAHRQLVVHRDLKPSNIVVDAAGHAFLLDFGIAKLMEEDAAGQTRTGERAFTPEYASPEQLHGEPVSTATDLYQLGVLLYALLAQAHPYGLTGDTPLRTRLARMDGDPQPLWDAALHASAEDAARRGGTPQSLAKQLRGDLSAIARRCLAPDPTQRYGGVDALRADLLAWLDGRPVAARAPTWRYRAGRFVRRNTLAVSAAAAVVVALCAGLGIALWQAHEARLQAQRADVVNAYLVDVFRSIDPEEGLGPDATVRQLIDAGVARLDRGELHGQPDAEGKLRLTLAGSYIALGEYPKAGEEVAQALRLLPPSQADDVMQARVRQCEILQLGERLDETGTCLDAAEKWRRAHAASLSEPEANAANLQIKRAQLLGHRERYEAAEKLALEAWQRLRTLQGDDGLLTLDARLQYAELLSSGPGRHAEAAAQMRAVVDGIRRIRPLNDFKLASALHNLAVYQALAGQNEQSAATERQALAIRRRILPPEHPYTALSIGQLAQQLEALGRNREALPLHEEATAIYRRQPGRGDDLGRELNNWGVACYQLGDMACATDKINEAVSVWAKALPADNSNLLAARGNLAALYSRNGNLAEGEAQLRKVASVLEAKLRAAPGAQTGSSLAVARNELSANLLHQGRTAEALSLARQNWRDLQAGGDAAEEAPSVLWTLALAELANGLPAPASQHARMALERAHASSPDSRREAFALMTLARTQLASHDAGAAAEQARKAIAMFAATIGDDHRDTGLAHGVLARALFASGQRADARKELDAAIAILSAKAAWLPELAELRALR